MEHTTHTRTTDESRLDTVCELLAHRRRRFAVSVLSERESPVALTELARAVASMAAETGPADVPAETVDEFAASLHHRHVPKLDDAGVVDYDAERKTVHASGVDEIAAVSE